MCSTCRQIKVKLGRSVSYADAVVGVTSTFGVDFRLQFVNTIYRFKYTEAYYTYN